MAANNIWIRKATETIIDTVGQDKAEELITKLLKIPPGNKSVQESMYRLRKAIKDRRDG